MPTDKSPAQAAFDTLVRDAVTAVLKSQGFKKAGNNHHRRLGSCVQVVNIQGSVGSSGEEKIFYVNVGVALDDICRHTGTPIEEKPLAHRCLERGAYFRLEQVVPRTPERWVVEATASLDALSKTLRGALEKLVEVLNGVDGLAGFKKSSLFSYHEALTVPAQVHFLLGDKRAARKVIDQVTSNFADREELCERDYWIKELKLDGLDD